MATSELDNQENKIQLPRGVRKQLEREGVLPERFLEFAKQHPGVLTLNQANDLKAVLAGQSYQRIAQREGVTTQAIRNNLGLLVLHIVIGIRKQDAGINIDD